MPIHRAGGKLTRSHTTLIEAAVPVVDLLEARPEVTKISLGIIKVIGKGLPAVKMRPATGGWKVVIRGNLSLQELVVYSSDLEATRHSLRAFSGNEDPLSGVCGK